jgi:hypothetical protein
MDGYQAILSFGFGLCCFALGYAVRAAISLHRRAKYMSERVELFDEQQMVASRVSEMPPSQTQPEESHHFKQEV